MADNTRGKKVATNLISWLATEALLVRLDNGFLDEDKKGEFFFQKCSRLWTIMKEKAAEAAARSSSSTNWDESRDAARMLLSSFVYFLQFSKVPFFSRPDDEEVHFFAQKLQANF